jgi:hypothetical protein
MRFPRPLIAGGGFLLVFALAAEGAAASASRSGNRISEPRKARALEGRAIPEVAGARASGSGARFFVGAGVLSHQPGRMSGSRTGAASSLGLVMPTLGLQLRMTEDWLFGPESVDFSLSLSGTPIPHSSSDGSSSTHLVSPLARLTRRLGSWDAGLGLGLMFYRVSGSGGISSQRNGSSSQDFVLPGSSSLAIYGLVDLAAGVSFWKLRADADVLLSGLLSARRSVDLLVGVSYGFE